MYDNNNTVSLNISVNDKWDFVETWIRVLDKKTDANRPLKEAAGLFAISSLVGPKAIIPLATDIDILGMPEKDIRSVDGLKLNEWFFIIGITEGSRKSTVAKSAKKYLNLVWSGKYRVPDIFTPEHLIDKLAETGGFLTWIMPEFATILEMKEKKDYMAALTGILQMLYDGEEFSMGTRTRGETVIPKPYVTAFLCTNLFAVEEKLITKGMIYHGFLNRMLLIWDDGVENFVPLADRILSLDSLETHNPDIEKLLSWGKKLYELDTKIILMPTGSVLKLIRNIEIKIHEELKKLDEVERAVRGRYKTHIWKLAGLYRISRLTENDLEEIRKGNNMLWIEDVDVERAVKFLSIVEKSFNRLLEEMRLAEVSKPKLESIEDLVETVKIIVLTCGKKEGDVYVIERTELYRQWFNKTKLKSDKLDEVLEDLEKQGIYAFKVEQSKGKGPGRPKQLCYFKF